MKKLLLALGFIIVSSLLFFGKGIQLRAFATNDELNVAVKRLTAGEAAAYNTSSVSNLNNYTAPIQAGDYAVSLTVTNNTGFAATGFRIRYDNYTVYPVCYAYEQAVYYKGEAAGNLNLTCEVNLNQGWVAMATTGSANSTADGIIYTFFFRTYFNDVIPPYDEEYILIDIDVDVWSDYHTTPISYSMPSGFTLYARDPYEYDWQIGDVNNDGQISIEDVQLIQGLYTYCGNGSSLALTDYTAEYTLYGTYNFNAIFIHSVCDINQDGLIDYTDMMEVFSYYTTYVIGHENLNNYTGSINQTAEYFYEYFAVL